MLLKTYSKDTKRIFKFISRKQLTIPWQKRQRKTTKKYLPVHLLKFVQLYMHGAYRHFNDGHIGFM